MGGCRDAAGGFGGDHGGAARGVWGGGGPVEVDALVGAVPAGGVAELAADAFVFVDVGHDLVVEVKVFPFAHLGEA